MSRNIFSEATGLAAIGLACFVAFRSELAQALTNSTPLDIFASGYVGQLRIQIPGDSLNRLQQSPRQYVRATITEGQITYTNVAIRLKGGPGSFRPINDRDDRPSFTVNFDKFAPGQTFHGLKKIHLNSSVQDSTYLHEKVARDLFLAAGVPVPRAAHAVIQVNNSQPRLCVLIEGADKQFLKRHFANAKGDLYESGQNRDVNQRLRVTSGDTNRAGLQRLARAAVNQDPATRLAELEKALDVDRFLSFLALEIMTDHWDGYAANINNYRVFHDLESNKIVFIPQGMDQVFRNVNAPIPTSMRGSVAQAVLDIPELRARFFERMKYLLTNVFAPERITNEIHQAALSLRPYLRERDQGIVNFSRRISQRAQNLERWLGAQAAPQPFSAGGSAAALEWKPTVQAGNPSLRKAQDGHPETLWISARENSIASWRTQVLLEPGQYRFSGRVKSTNLKIDPNDPKAGVSLRLSRQTPERRLSDSTDWVTLSGNFEIQDRATPIELVFECRAESGEAYFDRESLKVTRR